MKNLTKGQIIGLILAGGVFLGSVFQRIQGPQPLTERDLMGKCHESSRVLGVRICFYSNDDKGNYYRAYVGDEPRDFLLNCGGEGMWKVENNTIILGSNSSNCANIRSVAGRYPQ